jgi:endonuclease/exonuclease/phosphatase family metal-dependent hydrolase
MIKQLKKFTLQMVAGANIASILMMLLVGFSGYLNPADHHILANAGLAFPLFLLINFGFMVFWLIFKPKGVLIPLLGFIVCYQPVRSYIPFNVAHDAPEGSVKVLSFNVWIFAGGNEDGKPNPILEYIKEQKADIVCLQEASPYGIKQQTLDSVMGRLYEYSDTSCTKAGEDVLAVYSHFPIIHKEKIAYKSAGNHSAAFTLNIKGEKVLLINNHLETVGLSIEDKENFKTMMKGNMKRDSAELESRRLVDKIGEAAKIRAPQARAIAQYIKQHSNQSIICVGDFNDGPLSYAHRIIAKGLTDCYVSAGNGPGISYHQSGFYVRIDNIMCSKDWEPYRCKVDSKIKDSDHYPIYCWLKKRPKP